MQSLFLVYLKLHEMGSVRTFDSATTLTVCEGYDVTKQEHYFKKRCSCSCCDCLHRRCTFRVWQVLLFLFVVAVIIAGLALIIAMMETGKIATKHSALREADSPDNNVCAGKHISLVSKRVLVGLRLSRIITDVDRFSGSYNHDLPKQKELLV